MISLLLTLISFSGFAKTEASFVDACSEKAIRVSTPNGTRLNLKLDQLDPSDDLEVTVTYKPAGIIEDLKPDSQVVWKYSFQAEADGSFETTLNIPKAKWMWQVEESNAHYRIWDAEVSWHQLKARKAGSDIASFYRAPNKESYFELLSAGLCQWEKEAEVSSKMYENNTNTWMNISREGFQQYDQSNGPGISLGYNNNTGGTIPLASQGPSAQSFGWLFKNWEQQFNAHQILRVERRYVLNKEETGLYISRLSFTRHEVNRYQWIEGEGNQCGEFAAVSTGLLDVGITSEDFIVIPKNYYPRPQELKKYINTIRPPISNCEDSVNSEAQVATDILPSGSNGILFYYQTQNIRSHQ